MLSNPLYEQEKDQKYFVEKYILKIHIRFKTDYNQFFAFLYYFFVVNSAF